MPFKGSAQNYMADKLGREAHGGPRVKCILAAYAFLCLPGMLAAQTAADRAQAQAVASYVVQAGNVLNVMIYGWPTPADKLEGRFPVEANGKAHLPVVGTVDVAGKTTEQVQAELRQRLASEQNQAVLAIEPLFAVGVNGEVRQPGVFDFRPGQTVFDAISRASGYALDANRGKVWLVRDGQTRTLQAESQEALAALLATTPLQSGDRVMIGQRSRVSSRSIWEVFQALIAVATLYSLLSDNH